MVTCDVLWCVKEPQLLAFSGALKNPTYSHLVSRKAQITSVFFICLNQDKITLIRHTAHITQKTLVRAKL